MSGFQFGPRTGILSLAGLLLGAALPGFAQTQIHLQTQSRAVDFANAASTRPVKTGTTLPAICTVGEAFFKSNATAGANLYGCTATNTWTQMAASGGGTLVGDVTGSPSAATVVALRNRTLSVNTPSNGQVLAWNGSMSAWEPQTPAAAAMPFQTTYVSGTDLSIGTGCDAGNVCIGRFGNTSYQFAAAATAVISAGSGTAYVYLTPSGVLTVGHSMTLSSCTGCTAVIGVTSFPSDSIPLYTWSATSGEWASNGGTDWRSMISTKNVMAGIGLVDVSAGGATTLSLDTAVVGLRVAVPATSLTACTSGSWAADGSFFYMCQATDSWLRAALASW